MTGSVQDRFRGLMAGIAVGDAVGRPFEGWKTVPYASLDDLVTRSVDLLYSDDTLLSIALTESLVARSGFDGVDMSRRFALAWEAEPNRGYGGGVSAIFEAINRGADWKRKAEGAFGGAGSYGNGGAMRVAPVALWEYPDLEKTRRLAAETAKVTHTHPIGVEGAVIQAVAAHHALRQEFDPAVLLSEIDQLIRTDEFRTRFDALERSLQRGDDEYARLHLGNWVAADRSVLTALYCFLQSSGFEDTIRCALRIGGDVDTIAAMAGAPAGARWGLQSIPDSWVVEGYARMVGLADALFERQN